MLRGKQPDAEVHTAVLRERSVSCIIRARLGYYSYHCSSTESFWCWEVGNPTMQCANTGQECQPLDVSYTNRVTKTQDCDLGSKGKLTTQTVQQQPFLNGYWSHPCMKWKLSQRQSLEKGLSKLYTTPRAKRVTLPRTQGLTASLTQTQ